MKVIPDIETEGEGRCGPQLVMRRGSGQQAAPWNVEFEARQGILEESDTGERGS